MGQYVEAMAVSLQQWDIQYGTRRDLGFKYYKALSFAGLVYEKTDENGNKITDGNGNPVYEDTDSFKALVPEENDRTDIKKIIENEQNNNWNAKGRKCK